MALNFGNQGYRRDLNLSETESEAEAINNLGGAGISDDLRFIQNNLRNTSKIGFSTKKLYLLYDSSMSASKKYMYQWLFLCISLGGSAPNTLIVLSFRCSS